MRSIQARFENFKEKNKNIGDYIVLMRAVKDQKFSKQMISRWFNKCQHRISYWHSFMEPTIPICNRTRIQESCVHLDRFWTSDFLRNKNESNFNWWHS